MLINILFKWQGFGEEKQSLQKLEAGANGTVFVQDFKSWSGVMLEWFDSTLAALLFLFSFSFFVLFDELDDVKFNAVY